MNQAQSTISGSLLSQLPRGRLSTEQQAEAVQKVASQAEQRVRLGMQLFDAAESRLRTQTNAIEQLHNEHVVLQQRVSRDLGHGLQQCDQKIDDVDSQVTGALKQLEQKVDRMAAQWARTQSHLSLLARRSEALLEQNRILLEQHREVGMGTDLEVPNPLKFSPPPVSARPSDPNCPAKDEQTYGQILEQLRDE